MNNFFSNIKGFFEEKFPLATKVVESIPSAISSGFSKASNTLTKGAEDTSKMSVFKQAKRDLIDRPFNIAKFVFDANKFIIQAPLQATTKLGLSAIENVTGSPQSFKFNSPITKSLYGTDQINTIQSSVKAGESLVGKYGGSEIEKTLYPTPIIVGSIFLDLLPGQSSTKKLTKEALESQSKNLFESVLKETDTSKIEEILKQNYKGLSDDTYKAVSYDLARTQDGSTIYDRLKLIRNETTDPAIARRQAEQSFNADKYIKEQVAKQELSRGVEETLVGRLKKGLSELKPKFIDFTSPITDVVKRYKSEITPSTDINNNIDRVLRSNDLASQFIEDNGLKTVIQKVENVDALNQYLIAKHSVDLDTRGIETGREFTKDTLLVKQLSDKYEPMAQEINNYSKKLLDYITDSGIISKETSKELKATYPNYVPFNRIFSKSEIQGFNIPGGRAVSSASKQTLIRRIEGSERQVENPLESFMKKTVEAFEQAEKNKAASTLVNYKDLPGNPLDIKPLRTAENVKAKKEIIDQTSDEARMLSDLKTGPDRGVISVYKDGIRELYDVPKYVEEASKALKVQQIGLIGKILAAPVRVARLGITGIVPAFVLANLVKDQIFTAITGTKGFMQSIANPSIFMESLLGAISHNADYKEMVRMAAGGTSFDISRNQLKQTVDMVRSKRNIVSNVNYMVRHPSQLLRAVEDIVARGEEFTRLQQYKGTKEHYLKQGMNAEDAATSAAIAARENSVNFARRGEYGTALSSAFLYLNAGIQGSRRVVREFGNNPIQTAAKVATVILTPVAVTTAYNLSDEKRKAVYDDIADYEKENNIIIIPPNATKADNGKWNVIKIPLPAGIGSLGNIARKSIESYYTGSPINAIGMVQDIVAAFSPVGATSNSIVSSLLPQAVKPTVQAVSNYNFFTGLPQVSSSLSKLSPELQVKSNTSGTARKIGNTLGTSPIKVEEFTKDTFGRVGSYVLNSTDRALEGLDIIPKDQVGGISINEDIVNRFAKATGGEIDRKTQNELVEIITKQNDDRFKLKQEAELVYADIMSIPSEQKRLDKALEIKKVDPKLFEAIKTVRDDANKGLSYADRLLNSLGVENGERSLYIYNKMKNMSPEERDAYGSDLTKKGIATKNVKKQVMIRLKNQTE